jgi:hypothetical protein
MTLDFQQIREQIKQLGENMPARELELQALYELAYQVFQSNAYKLDHLRSRVQQVVNNFYPFIRCALPVSEPLDKRFSPPPLPQQATLLAADGSQIAPDRHASVDYCLINVGAIQMQYGRNEPPSLTISSRLFYDGDLFTPGGMITEATLALMRDLYERKILAEIAITTNPPVITFTDGQMELWGRRGEGMTAIEFQKRLDEYLAVLRDLCDQDVITAGYVDKPAANHVVRLLELALLPESELSTIRDNYPLRGIKDINLFSTLLQPGERSAIFGIQSRFADYYHDSLSLHFFYLNVGRDDQPWLVRVEIPAWVAENESHLNTLHALLLEQCRILGSHPYPYLLHRAHELAVVSLEEKEQVEKMINLELYKRGVSFAGPSHKQALKDSRKKRYS